MRRISFFVITWRRKKKIRATIKRMKKMKKEKKVRRMKNKETKMLKWEWKKGFSQIMRMKMKKYSHKKRKEE